jgi:hypothetical protein
VTRMNRIGTRRPIGPTKADVETTVDRTIGLMRIGLSFADAAELATREVANEIVDRQEGPSRARQEEAQRDIERQRELRVAEERARYRAQLDAKAPHKSEPPPPGPRTPTLKASLGDLMRFKLR